MGGGGGFEAVGFGPGSWVELETPDSVVFSFKIIQCWYLSYLPCSDEDRNHRVEH